ncbi:MAG: hypothetical protein AAGA99_16980 [Actinomycetota bacterium]
MTKRSALAAVAAALLLLLAACGSGDDVAAGDDPPTLEEFQDTPLSEFMGWNQDQQDFEEEYAVQEAEAQELMVSCMAEQGFEYQPVDHGEVDFFDPYTDSDVEPGTREWAETYGYGWLTFFEEEQAGFAVGEAETFTDPNEEYLQSLSDGERDAYYRALYGDEPDFDPSLSDEELDELFSTFVPTGCDAEARAEVFGDGFFGGGGSEEMEEFWALSEELYQRIEGDPRVAEASGEWSACMADAGHDFSTQEDIFLALDERSQEFWESQTWPGEDLTEAEYEQLSPEELDAIFSQPPEYDQELLDELQAYEIDVAVSDFDCGASMMRIRLEVQRELEAEFVETNRELLEQVRDEMP